MYIILSVTWLIASVLLFAWWFSNPTDPMTRIWGSDVPLAWIAVFMLVYNLFRWWSVKQSSRTRRDPAQPLPPRPVVKRDEEGGPVRD